MLSNLINYDKLKYAVPAFVYNYDTAKLCGGHDVDMSGKIGKNGVDCYSKNGHAVTVLTRQS